MFDIFFIFSSFFLRRESQGQDFLMTQKIEADKVNTMECDWECDPESTSVTIQFFLQNLTQYAITHVQWNFEINLWSRSVYIKLSTKVFKKYRNFGCYNFLCSDLSP